MSSFVGFLSGADKYGRWVPDSEVTASAYLGGTLLKQAVQLPRVASCWQLQEGHAVSSC